MSNPQHIAELCEAGAAMCGADVDEHDSIAGEPVHTRFQKLTAVLARSSARTSLGQTRVVVHGRAYYVGVFGPLVPQDGPVAGVAQLMGSRSSGAALSGG